ncbi:MAG: hypothetical protein GEU75_04915 [Dehalococcoidia bacterium]|nr:hypothetical protein [Dehalococcoidia bacterium]
MAASLPAVKEVDATELGKGREVSLSSLPDLFRQLLLLIEGQSETLRQAPDGAGALSPDSVVSGWSVVAKGIEASFGVDRRQVLLVFGIHLEEERVNLIAEAAGFGHGTSR